MRTLLVTVLVLVFGLGGCAMQGENPGGSSAGLTDVRKADFESEVFYIDRSVSSAPLTAEQAVGLEAAVPVRIVFYDEWAVAWQAPDGEAVTGQIDYMVNAWRIYERAETIDGALAPEDQPQQQEDTAEVPSLISTAQIDLTGVEVDNNRQVDADIVPPIARLDWYIDNFDELLALPPGYHPGCT